MGRLVRTIGLVAVVLVVGLGGATSASAAPRTAAEHRAFVQAGFSGTTDEEYVAWVQALSESPDGAVMRLSATSVLAGPIEGVRAYADGGYLSAWRVDERRRLIRLIPTATLPNVDRELQAVLDLDDTQSWTDFLNTGLGVAQYADDRLAAARMLLGAPDNSGPALDAAAQAALAGTPEQLREFIVTGQLAARALDAQAAAPVQPGAPAVPAPAAPAPAAPAAAAAAPAAAAAQAPRAAAARSVPRGTPTVLAATGVAERPTAGVAAAAILTGAALVLLARRRAMR